MARRPKRKKKTYFDSYDYSSLKRTIPPCPHFGSCGGCSLQDIEYSSQLVLKKDYLKDLFNQEVDVFPATEQLAYRNRMDFVYAYGDLGMRKKGDFRTVIPLTTCLLFPEPCQEVFVELKKLLSEHSIESYDFIEHSGFLRYIVFRHAPSTGELMLVFTSTTPSKDQEKALKEVFDILKEKVTSLYWLINDSITDISVPIVEPFLCLGKTHITEKIGDVSLLVSPFSFFQANTQMASLVFEKIKEQVTGETVDLCCGVGTIGLLVADNAKSVLGIEEVADAIVLANENKKLNKKENVLFFTSSMKHILDFTPLHVDTLIVDPPRAGLEKKVVKRILELAPEKIIYMSCNPKTQKSDLDLIAESEAYDVDSLEAFDMFPQTSHLETLLVLKRR